MTGTHILASPDPQQLLKDVEKFTADKTGVEKFYSSTPIPTGQMPGGQFNLTLIASCLILWECTVDEWKSFQFSQQMAIQKS